MIVSVLIFIVMLSKESAIEFTPVIIKRHFRHAKSMEGLSLNITDELLSPNSVIRQLSDQIALGKAFVVIAKEINNLQFAWELSAQIRNSQILLSNAATRRTPPSHTESETAIHDMALLLYQAQQLHYDSATMMIMRLKAKIQTLEEQIGSEAEKSSKYGQIAAEEFPKSLYCVGVNKNKNKRQVDLKLEDSDRFHFCVFSDNILATSVVVNSKNPDMVVEHM